MIAVAVLLTSFLVTVPVYAASKPMVVKSYMLAKGEKFTLNVYNEPDNAKISYKSLYNDSCYTSINGDFEILGLTNYLLQLTTTLYY